MLDDISAAFHSLKRHPGFTLLAVVTLALGIGATTAVFSVTEAVLLRPLPYFEPDRLVDISQRTKGTRRLTVNQADIVDLRRETRLFEDVAGRGMGAGDAIITGPGDEAYHVTQLSITYNYFQVLGVEPALGRAFIPEDAIPMAPPEDENAPPPVISVIISHGLWQRALGGDPDLEAGALRIHDFPLRVVGVLPPDFQLLHERHHRWVKGTSVEMFSVMSEEWLREPTRRGGPGARGLLALGRLQPGVSYAQAQAALDLMAERLRTEYATYANEELQIDVYPLHQDLTAYSRRSVFVVAGGVAFLMLLVCANVANLQLVRARVRSGEDAVRAALGCGRRRLFGLRVWESLLLSFTGAGIGVGLGWAAMRVVLATAPRTVPLLNRIEMNSFAVLFAVVMAITAVILSGLLPAIRTSRLDPARTLNQDARGASAQGRRRLMDSLVVSELALSMVLLSGAAFMVRTLMGMSRMELGYQPEGVVSFEMDLPWEDYQDTEALRSLFHQLEERLAAIPGVEALARTRAVPLGDAVSNTTYGWSRETFEQQIERGDVVISTASYLPTMGTRLLAGRYFTEHEVADSIFPVIVDAQLAATAWPNDDPLGKQIFFWPSAQEGVVVGVVEFMLSRDIGLGSYEAIHVPEEVIGPGAAQTFVLRTRPGTASLATAIRAALKSVDPKLEPYRIQGLAERVSMSMGPTRFVFLLMAAFAVVALVVAAVGLFGVIAFTVRGRTTELGIRIAIGAQRKKVLTMVLRQGALLTLLGVAGGTVAALLLARFIQAVAYEASPTEPVTLALTALALGATSMLACVAPARWACRVDPIRALRGE